MLCSELGRLATRPPRGLRDKFTRREYDVRPRRFFPKLARLEAVREAVYAEVYAGPALNYKTKTLGPQKKKSGQQVHVHGRRVVLLEVDELHAPRP